MAKLSWPPIRIIAVPIHRLMKKRCQKMCATVWQCYTPFTRSSKHRANVEQMYSKYPCDCSTFARSCNRGITYAMGLVPWPACSADWVLPDRLCSQLWLGTWIRCLRPILPLLASARRPAQSTKISGVKMRVQGAAPSQCNFSVKNRY